MVGIPGAHRYIVNADVFDILGLDPNGNQLPIEALRAHGRYVEDLLDPDSIPRRIIARLPYDVAHAHAVNEWLNGGEHGGSESLTEEQIVRRLYANARDGHQPRWNPQLVDPRTGQRFRRVQEAHLRPRTTPAARQAAPTASAVARQSGNPHPSTSQGTPSAQRSSNTRETLTSQRTPTIQHPPMAQSTPTVRRAPDVQSTPNVRSAPITQRTPTTQRAAASSQRTPITQRTPVAQRTPVTQRSPITQRAPANPQGLLTAQRRPAAQGVPASRRAAANNPSAATVRSAAPVIDISSDSEADAPEPIDLTGDTSDDNDGEESEDDFEVPWATLVRAAGDREGRRVAVALVPVPNVESRRARLVVTAGMQGNTLNRRRVTYQITSHDINGQRVAGAARSIATSYDRLVNDLGAQFLGRFRGMTAQRIANILELLPSDEPNGP